jgi:hypothetical protein
VGGRKGIALARGDSRQGTHAPLLSKREEKAKSAKTSRFLAARASECRWKKKATIKQEQPSSPRLRKKNHETQTNHRAIACPFYTLAAACYFFSKCFLGRGTSGTPIKSSEKGRALCDGIALENPAAEQNTFIWAL